MLMSTFKIMSGPIQSFHVIGQEKLWKEQFRKGKNLSCFCDNLNAQTSDEFKDAVRGINGIVYFGVPGKIEFISEYQLSLVAIRDVL